MWDLFEKTNVDVGDPPLQVRKGKCKTCHTLIAADPKLNGTSGMWKYHASCLKKQQWQTQMKLNQEGSGSIISWRFNQTEARIALGKYIILDELPFQAVKKEGFKIFMGNMSYVSNLEQIYSTSWLCEDVFAT